MCFQSHGLSFQFNTTVRFYLSNWSFSRFLCPAVTSVVLGQEQKAVLPRPEREVVTARLPRSPPRPDMTQPGPTEGQDPFTVLISSKELYTDCRANPPHKSRWARAPNCPFPNHARH